jgi:hypothetical protein
VVAIKPHENGQLAAVAEMQVDQEGSHIEADIPNSPIEQCFPEHPESQIDDHQPGVLLDDDRQTEALLDDCQPGVLMENPQIPREYLELAKTLHSLGPAAVDDMVSSNFLVE